MQTRRTSCAGARSSSSRSKVQRDEARRRLNDLQQLQKPEGGPAARGAPQQGSIIDKIKIS